MTVFAWEQHERRARTMPATRPAIHLAALFVLALSLTGCDPFRPYNPAVFDSNWWDRPTPHLGTPSPGIDDDKPWPYDGFTAGPFYKDVRTFRGGRIVSALGPLIRYERMADGTKRFFIPFLFSYGERFDPTHSHIDKVARFLWPIGHYIQTARETRFVLYPLLWIKLERNPYYSREHARSRLVIKLLSFSIAVPAMIEFTYDSKDGATFGIAPVIGTIRHFLGRDRITFYGPLTFKATGSGLTSHFILYPLIGWWKSDDGRRRGWQVFPFYKIDRKTGNMFSRYILWPLWNEWHSQLDTRHPTHSYALFPFFIRRQSVTRSQWTILWPFFHYYERRQYPSGQTPSGRIVPRREYSFWPLFHFATGPTVHALTIWPLFKYRFTPRLSYVTIGPGREMLLPFAFMLNLFRGGALLTVRNPGERLIPNTVLLYEWERTTYRDYVQSAHRWFLFAHHIVRTWFEKSSQSGTIRRATRPASGALSPDRAEGFARTGSDASPESWRRKSEVRSLVWPLWRYDRTAGGSRRIVVPAPVFIRDTGQIIESEYGFLWEIFKLESIGSGDRRMRALFGTVRADWSNTYIHHGIYPLYDWWSVYDQPDRRLFSVLDGIAYRYYRSPLVRETGNVLFRFRREIHPTVTGIPRQQAARYGYQLVKRWEILWGALGIQRVSYVRNGREFRAGSHLRFLWTSIK